jgi:predicted nucleic acid-binding Zn ribbon protein
MLSRALPGDFGKSAGMRPEKLRARALAEWRGLPETPFPVDRSVSVADAIPKLMQSLGLKDRLKADAVMGAWREVVGEFVARHSAPRQLKDGVLLVSVLQPTVLFELERMWKKEILEKLKARFGARTVREIKFRIG